MDTQAFDAADELARSEGAVSFTVRRSAVPSLWMVMLVFENGDEVGYDLIRGHKGIFQHYLCPQSLLDQRELE